MRATEVVQDASGQALDFSELSTKLRTALIVPSDGQYDSARAVYNGMIDKRPAAIARCVDVADVIAAVQFAREQRLTLAVRGGGHNGAGTGTCADGLVLDLSLLKGVRIDPVGRTATVASGCTWGDVDHATHAFGCATPSGIVGSTGVGGLTLGGGLGHLTRAYELSIDNLLEADIVLADASFVTVDAQQHPDLFWAIRGGGGNFGVVTSFTFKLHPVRTVVGGPMLWPMDRAREVMQWYRDFIATAPEEINGFFAFLKVPPGPPFPEDLHFRTMCGIIWCFVGAPVKADVVFAPIRSIAGGPIVDLVGVLPYPALQSLFDPLFPAGLQWYWRADFVNELSDAAIDVHIEHASRMPSVQSGMHVYPINGAAGRVGRHDTAWSYRDATWGSVIAGVDPDPANADRIRDWTVAYWEALHPHSAGGAYVNMMMDEGVDRVRSAYRDNYDRLVEIKNRYDPTNLFRVNQNIKPTV